MDNGLPKLVGRSLRGRFSLIVGFIAAELGRSDCDLLARRRVPYAPARLAWFPDPAKPRGIWKCGVGLAEGLIGS